MQKTKIELYEKTGTGHKLIIIYEMSGSFNIPSQGDTMVLTIGNSAQYFAVHETESTYFFQNGITLVVEITLVRFVAIKERED